MNRSSLFDSIPLRSRIIPSVHTNSVLRRRPPVFHHTWISVEYTPFSNCSMAMATSAAENSKKRLSTRALTAATRLPVHQQERSIRWTPFWYHSPPWVALSRYQACLSGIEGPVALVAEADEVAESAFLQELPDRHVRGMEVVHVAYGELFPGPLRGRDHGVALLDADRHRLLDEDVHAGLQGGDRLFAVQPVRGADD